MVRQSRTFLSLLSYSLTGLHTAAIEKLRRKIYYPSLHRYHIINKQPQLLGLLILSVSLLFPWWWECDSPEDLWFHHDKKLPILWTPLFHGDYWKYRGLKNTVLELFFCLRDPSAPCCDVGSTDDVINLWSADQSAVWDGTTIHVNSYVIAYIMRICICLRKLELMTCALEWDETC